MSSDPIGCVDGARHDHALLCYESRDEQLSTLLPFVERGLRANERCLLVCHETPIAEMENALSREISDVEEALTAGQLLIHDPEDVLLFDGSFDPERVVDGFDRLRRGAEEDGYDGFRMSGEMSWMLEYDVDPDRIQEYEQLLDERFPAKSGLAICQYDRSRFPPAALDDLLEHHPQVARNDECVDNVYYGASGDGRGNDPHERVLDRKLGALDRHHSITNSLETVAQSITERHLEAIDERPDERETNVARSVRMNSLLRSSLESLRSAESEADLACSICDLLHRETPAAMVWYGTDDPAVESIRPLESAGDEQGYLDALTAEDGWNCHEPAGRAIRSGSIEFERAIMDNRFSTHWADQALKRGLRSVVSVPVAFDGSTYGVLSLYARTPDAFDDEWLAVLEELSTAVAYGIRNVNCKRGPLSSQATDPVLGDVLTERQLEVLQLAYRTGYFEQPRKQTTSELADQLRVSHPTVSRHVREAERRILSHLFDGDDGVDE